MTSTPELESKTGKQVFEGFEELADPHAQHLLELFKTYKNDKSRDISNELLEAFEDATEIRLTAKLLQEKGGYKQFLAMMKNLTLPKGGKR